MQNSHYTLPHGIVQCSICGCFQPPNQVNTDQNGIHTCTGGHAKKHRPHADEHPANNSQQSKQNA
jgi:hypothetical protein